jgi:hypothetical protein
MGLFSTIGKALNNPFVRQIATGIAGVVGGPAGATLVNKGFTLFDGIKSAFEATKSATPMSTGSTLQDPRTAMVGSSSYAATASQVDGSAGSTGAATTDIGRSISGAFPNGYGLTAAQQKIFADAGVDPNSEEGKSMKLQMMMANYKNMMEMVSNIGKMLTELSSSIIRNIRA